MGTVSHIERARGIREAKGLRRQMAEAGVTLHRPKLDWGDEGFGSVETLYAGEEMPLAALEEIAEIFDIPLITGAKRPSDVVRSIATGSRTPR